MPSHGFVRVAAAVPRVHVAQPRRNVDEMRPMIEQAHAEGVQILCFPELGITGYTCGDLFLQQELLLQANDALKYLLTMLRGKDMIVIVGMPIAVNGQRYNVAVVCNGSRPIGVVPKIYIPNYREFQERRWYSSGSSLKGQSVIIADQLVWSGTDLLFDLSAVIPDCIFAVEICEDLWIPIPPSCFSAIYGATIQFNPSASDAVVGKAEYRRDLLVAGQSGRCVSSYVYVSSSSCIRGGGESTAEFVHDGHIIIAENGSVLAESERFSTEPQLIIRDIDIGRLMHDRLVMGTFGQCRDENPRHMRRVPCAVKELSL